MIFPSTTSCVKSKIEKSTFTKRKPHVASLRAGLTLIGSVIVGNVGDNVVSGYRLHARADLQRTYNNTTVKI